MARRFEELRNSNGVLYKLKGKLCSSKEAKVPLVPKTNMVYLHINDVSKAFKDGAYDHKLAKSVSLSIDEAKILRELLSTMDGQVQELAASVPVTAPVQGKIRKMEATTAASDVDYRYGTQQQLPAYPGYQHSSSVPHNQGLRLALGAFRTSPVSSLNVEADEPSLWLRREKLSPVCNQTCC